MREYWLKRPFDFILALTGIIAFLPLWVLCGFLIWFENGWPVFYLQARVGKNKKEFTIIKFRSMIKDAEKNTGAVLAIKGDLRITRVGRILRATAMDELPQLLSILRGDMSFVGPRPERPELVSEFSNIIPQYNLRHKVKPGLTGVAQVFGKYNTAPRQKLKYDFFYIKKQNFWFDLHIIALSVWITLRGKWGMGGGLER